MQELATNKSFEDYQLLGGGYGESLLTSRLKQGG